MITAKFGSKSFEVTSKKIHTVNNVSYKNSVNFEETEVSGKKPTVNIKGLNLKELSFEVVLDARFVTVDSEIKYWEDKLLAKKSENFSLGKKTLGRFYLTEVDVDNIIILKEGTYSKAKLSLSFKEDGNYANNELFPPPKVTEVKNSASSTKKIGIGTMVIAKKGTRWYYTAMGAINKTGISGASWQQKVAVSHIYNNGQAIALGAWGWMLPSEVDVV